MSLNKNLYGLVSFILFMQWRLCTGGYAPCPQAEVGETITLRGTFINKFEEKPEIIWKNTYYPYYSYSKCNPYIGCRDSIKGKTETSLTPKGNNVYEFSLKIKSITAEDFNVWYLKYSGTVALVFNEPLYSCNLTRKNSEKTVPLDIYTECYRVLQNATDCYIVLHNATECYRVLQSATECYRVLQSATECYRELQRTTENYRVLQSVT
jgi:hypothetical protein